MSTEKQREFLQNETGKIGLELTDRQVDQFLSYYESLIETNRVMNLTAITEFEDVVRKHFVDSLSLSQVMKLKSFQTLIDVGTGAGFPGVPLKILYPHLKVTLVDSLGKRVRFLTEVIENLNLQNIEAIHGRAEDLARNSRYREKFDLCTSRAVSNLAVLAEYDLPFVKRNGYFVSYKAANSEDEIKQAEKAIRILGGKIEKVDRFTLDDMGRAIIQVKKVKSTSLLYPRKAGTPAKNPLL
jgi:16S rRNA (guanine527-N7)-methyltransferase